MIDERFDRRLAVGATGLLAEFNAVGVLEAPDVHVARRLGALLGESDQVALLAVAFAVRAVRHGSICVDLATVADSPLDMGEEPVALPWPGPEAWLAAVAASPVLAQQAIRLEGSLLYLDRYWREECQIRDDLVAREGAADIEVDELVLETAGRRIFPDAGYDEQRAAAATACRRLTTVLTGGPGTGKTTTVAGLLAMLDEQYQLERGRPPRIALCAPTGKAAARLQESIRAAATPGGDTFPELADRKRVARLEAMTMHRLLGWVPDSSVRFRHDRSRRLAYDVVVVDEASMISATMMARLLEALRPTTQLILIGDKDQLSSVEAGAVLADMVAGFADRLQSPVVELTRNHRFGDGTGLAELAQALRERDADQVLEVLRHGWSGVELIDPDDTSAMAGVRTSLTGHALDILRPAEDGDVTAALAALDEHRLLCAHRNGPYGVSGWNHEIERLVAERTGVHRYDEWYAGRPVLITANDRALDLYNGDTGVAVRTIVDGEPRVRVAVPGHQVRLFSPSRVPAVQTVHAMTVHKSQGSQARSVTVVLPPEDSALLTRELFYTAVTRAQEKVRVIASEAAVRAAVTREVQRATGLSSRLSAHPHS